MPIQKFFLQCSYGCNENRVNNWLRIVTHRKVKTLDFRIPHYTYTFYWDFFETCNNTLVKLTLEGAVVLFMPEAEWLFPFLKKLNLRCIEYFGKQSLVNLISGCPVLEELCLYRLQLSHNS